MILITAEDWGIPPWEIAPEGYMTRYRWLFLWTELKDIRSSADEARAKAAKAGAKL